jgi:CheY-like chemotaxis protein
VDDEDLARASTADMLADLGYEVVEAASAEQALQLFDQGLRADVLVTDHLMPGKTGVDLAREVQSRRIGAAVVIISGFAEMEGVAPDLPRLTKPFRQSELADMLSTIEPKGG